MFILRSIANGREPIRNQAIGNYYELYMRNADENWEEHISGLGLNAESEKECVGIIYHPPTGKTPLYRNWEYFMMTESGKTFERL